MAWYDRILSFFDPAPDPKPDLEDTGAYNRMRHIQEKFEEHGAPVQLLKDSSKKPTDVSIGRDDLHILPAQGGMTSWVDVYDGPQGKGFVVHFEVLRNGKPFQKSINIGPETHREKDWTERVETLNG